MSNEIELTVNDLVAASGYNIDYMHQLLRKLNISNRFLLVRSDLEQIKDNLDLVSSKRYDLYIFLKHTLERSEDQR